MYHTPSLRTTPRATVRLAARPQTWHRRAVEAYKQTAQDEIAALPVDLIARVAALTGRTLSRGSVYIDRAKRAATVALDGIVFRLRRGELVLLRPCAECGLGHYETPAIGTLADLGYALSTWQPNCQNCAPEDPIGWLEREDA
jgi:hypothetical protein